MKFAKGSPQRTKSLLQQSRPEVDLHQKILYERSLHDFYRASWRYIDPAPFTDGRHFECLCQHLEAVARGDIKRLLINIQPRVSKSTLCSVAFPAWLWSLNGPYFDDWTLAGADKKILSLSFAHSLATRDSRRSRNLIKSPWYQQYWGDEFSLSADQNAKHRYDNNLQGFRMSTTPLGQVLGEGGDLILFDDPHKASDIGKEAHWQTIEFFQETLPNRLNSKDSAVIVIMQRLHERDISGVILETGGYHHVCLPAEYDPHHKFHFPGDWRKEKGELLWPEKMSAADLAKRKSEMTQYAISGQLQQLPVPRDGGKFKRDWFILIDAIPEEVRLHGQAVRFWDMAGSEVTKTTKDPDYTAGVKMWGYKGSLYIEDVEHFRLTSAKAQARIETVARRDTESCYIRMEQEPGSSGKGVIETYQSDVLPGFNFRGIKSTGSKEQRSDLLETKAENGQLFIIKAPWTDGFIEEMTLFPNGPHDDRVDAASGAATALAAIMRRDDLSDIAVPVQVRTD